MNLETFESRQFLSAVLGGPIPRPAVAAPSGAIVQNLKRARRAVVASTPSFLGYYSGRFEAADATYLGAVSISLTSQDASGAYFGYFGYQTPTSSQRLPVQVRVQTDGQFTIRYLSAKSSLQVAGRIDPQTGAVTGRFQVLGRGWRIGGNLVMGRTQTLPDPHPWDPA